MNPRIVKIRPTALGLVSLLTLVVPQAARAEDLYCARARARAGSDSALLYAPTVRVEGVKLPSGLQKGGQLDPTSSGSAYQLRAGVTLSPSNIYKGVIVDQAGESDCDAHKSIISAQELVLHAPDIGRLGALRDQLRVLDSQKIGWDAIEAKMLERLAAQTSTLVEVEDVRTKVVLLERTRAQVRGEVERLTATGFDASGADLTRLARDVQSNTNRFERDLVRIRAIDPWEVNVTGGYLPPVATGTKDDWFGVVQLSYNVGQYWHGRHDARYLESREQELKTARYELPRQLEVLKQHVASASTQARTELAVVNTRIESLVASRASLAQSESTLAPHALAMIDLELISAASDKAFLEGLIRELGRIQEK